MNLFNRVVVGVLPIFPHSLIWLFAKRYTAGVDLSDAVEKVKCLNAERFRATMDTLGENITKIEEADAAREASLSVLDVIKSQGLDANLSVKLTQLGLKLDPARCEQNIRRILKEAQSRGLFVRIDMEDSSCTQETLNLYRTLRKDHTNAGVVIQAYLKRSPDDVQALVKDGLAHVRLCKGIYIEPADIALKRKDEIREQYMALAENLLESGSFIGIATHDIRLIKRSVEMIRRRNIGKERYEFQMLLGVKENIRRRLVAEGHPVRVYVPYGKDWYPYSMRRLKENPAVAGHIIKNLLWR